MVFTVTQHCRQTVIDMVEEEWQGAEKRLTEGKSEPGNGELLRGRASLGSMEATVQKVGGKHSIQIFQGVGEC